MSAFELGDWHQPTAGEDRRQGPARPGRHRRRHGHRTKAPADASVYFGVAIAGQWTTPALGQLSRVAVLIDTNFDKKADYEIAV